MAVPGDSDLRRHVVHSTGLRGPHVRLRVLPGRRRGGRVKSDLCVALGTELGEPMPLRQDPATGRSNDAKRKWVYWSNRIRRPSASTVRFDVPLVGDLRGVVPQLVESARVILRANPHPSICRPLDRGGCRESLRSIGDNRRRPDRTPIHPARYRRRGHQGVQRTRGRHHGPRRWRDRDLPVDLLAGQAARRHLEPELRPPRHRVCRTRSGHRWPRAVSAR